jgi:hypothetical protein
MDDPRLLKRIEAGEFKVEDDRDGLKISVEVEAVDQLGVLVKRVGVESPRKGALPKQASAIVERVTYLGGPLKVIEMDGVSNAAQIRSAKPEKDGFVEVVLRGGTSVSVEKLPNGTIHVSKGDFNRLVDDLTGIF